MLIINIHIRLFIIYYHNIAFIKCYTILKTYPPAKNENKFLYGILIQTAVIKLLDNIFYSCIDLDEKCKVGSNYKVDCKLNITRYLNVNLSIKGKKHKIGKVIIINKNSNNKNYDLSVLISIIIIIELKDIIIIPHKIIPKLYIEDNDANISYKSSLFTFLYKNQEYKKKYIINLVPNDEYKLFYKNEFPHIKPKNILFCII